MTTPYTYLITHNPSGKRYYGVRYAEGCDPSDLWVTYFTSSKDVKALDPSECSYEVRKTFATPEEAFAWEQTVIDRMKLFQREDWYNRGCMRKKGTGFRLLCVKGSVSDETRRRLSQAGKGRKHTPETIAKMRERANSPEGRRMRSEAAKRRNQNISPETRAKLSESSSKQRHTPEAKTKLSTLAKNRSPEHAEKIRLSVLGRTHSQETKKKMQDRHREIWRQRKERAAALKESAALEFPSD